MVRAALLIAVVMALLAVWVDRCERTELVISFVPTRMMTRAVSRGMMVWSWSRVLLRATACSPCTDLLVVEFVGKLEV